MSQQIQKVAILGAGTMGAQIAGHVANAGIPVSLFDLNQDLSKKGIENLTTLKPAPLFNKKNVELIEPCNYDDHLDKLNEVDWVLEAVAERLDIKQTVFQNIAPHLKDDVTITTNTSGLSVEEICGALPEKFKNQFLLTHFFNPPRYLRLVEIVPHLANPEIVSSMTSFLENKLGKGIVNAKDTPNFIANRIGMYGMMTTLKMTEELGLTVEEVDKLTGTIIGRAKSATFRTADIVGLDVMIHVATNSYEKCSEDEDRDIYKIPGYLQKLVDDGRLGQKTKAGFYKKTDDGIMSLDFKTLEYTPQKKVRFDGFRLAKDRTLTPAKIKTLAESDDKGGKFFWEILSRSLIYSANRIPEISDDIVNIDNALKWGFGWEFGPFETWDAIGVPNSLNRMANEGKKIPTWVEEMVNSGRTSFYDFKNGSKTYFDIPNKTGKDVSFSDSTINLALKRTQGNIIKKDWSASLIDLGDSVLNVQFHSALQPVLNPIDLSIADMINEGLNLLEAGKYKGMVMGHQGPNFCAGANLALILNYCEEGNYDGLSSTIKGLQDLTQRIRFSPAPVVAAPFNLVLGGGYELIAPCAKRVCSAELYCGLVEVGVGLIPGAGGNLRLILNYMEESGDRPLTPFQLSQKALEIIGFAKVSFSAVHAMKMKYLRSDDEIVMNSDHLIKRAKDAVLEIADGYEPPKYREDIVLAGKGGRTAMTVALKGYRLQGKISAHDEFIAKKLAHLLTGGEKGGSAKPVDEQFLLDLEREVFVSLAGEPKTHDRIRYMLKKGKPLRN